MIPRHEFIPDVIWGLDDVGWYVPLSRTEHPDRWMAECTSDDPVVTQADDGSREFGDKGFLPTSSSSAPAAMAEMITALDVRPGMNALEIGTGTGYNAAMLADIVGQENVTTIEVDSGVAAHARVALTRAGCHVDSVLGDGALGYPPNALYDRLIATVSAQVIPYAWIEQVRPGGRIVTPVTFAFRDTCALPALTVQDDGSAVGRFRGGLSFMLLRSQRHPEWGEVGGPYEETSTQIYARELICLQDVDSQSWAAFTPGTDEHLVRQHGGRIRPAACHRPGRIRDDHGRASRRPARRTGSVSTMRDHQPQPVSRLQPDPVLSRRHALGAAGAFAVAALAPGVRGPGGLGHGGLGHGGLGSGALGSGAAAGRAGAATGPALTRLGDTLLDPAALYFVSFDGLVNNESFQLNGILTYAGHQYTAWYTADRSAVLARRALPGGPWQTLVLPHRLSTDDSHNVISLAVSPEDGRMHVAMDVHNTTIFYTKSEPGLMTSPRTRSWSASRFGVIQRTLDGVGLGGISYPQFLLTPENRLQFSFRTGGSGNGTNELAEYSAGAWTRLGKWSGATGTFTTGGATSTTRNMYLHGLTYGPGGRLHAAFTWREGNLAVLCAPGGLSNHDTGYVYSDDRGRTWRNGAGAVVGATGGTLVSIDSPGHVVDAVGVDQALMNQESQAVDSAGRPHVIISYVPERVTTCVTSYAADRTANARTFHLHLDAAGAWHKTELPMPPNATGRSRLVFDRHDNAYVVMPFGRIAAASARSGWADWRLLFDGAGLNAFGEVIVDYPRVAASDVLSILFQETSAGTTPSPIRVVDFRLG